jgi:hypothetical protein
MQNPDDGFNAAGRRGQVEYSSAAAYVVNPMANQGFPRIDALE